MDDTKEKSIGDELKEDEFHEISPHSHRDALWSCAFCGLFGTHRYLVGRWGDGMAALNVLCWIGAVICGITLYSLKICLGWIVLNLVWWVWDLIRIILRRYSDGKGRPLDENDDGTYSSWEVCTDLCAFWGGYGIHRLYLGRKKSGYFMLIISITSIPFIILEWLLRCIFAILLAIRGEEVSATGSKVLSRGSLLLAGLFLLPSGIFSSAVGHLFQALIIFLTIGYVCYVAVNFISLWDLMRSLFSTFHNAHGHELLKDPVKLAKLRRELHPELYRQQAAKIALLKKRVEKDKSSHGERSLHKPIEYSTPFKEQHGPSAKAIFVKISVFAVVVASGMVTWKSFLLDREMRSVIKERDVQIKQEKEKTAEDMQQFSESKSLPLQVKEYNTLIQGNKHCVVELQDKINKLEEKKRKMLDNPRLRKIN